MITKINELEKVRDDLFLSSFDGKFPRAKTSSKSIDPRNCSFVSLGKKKKRNINNNLSWMKDPWTRSIDEG